MQTQAEILKLKKTIRLLRQKNQDLSNTLNMIQTGQVDSLIISGPFGEKVFTLQSSEQPYRELVDTLNEGIVTLSSEGIILYCNAYFQIMSQTPLDKLIGTDIRAHLTPDCRYSLEFALERGRTTTTRTEVFLNGKNKTRFPIQLSISPFKSVGVDGYCLVATNLTNSKQNTVLFQQQEWLGKILNLLPVPFVLLENEMKGFSFINEKAKFILRGMKSNGGQSNSESFSFSFVNDNGQIFSLEELLEKVRTFGGRNGYETCLVVQDKRVPVLLFVESLPSIEGLPAAQFLVFQDLSALNQAQQDLSQTLRGRDQFMSALSHELRTPLNVILGWVQLIRSHPSDQSIVQQAIDTLERNANLQRDLIEDLLDMSRIVTGNLVLEKKPFDLRAMLNEIILTCRMKASEKDVSIFLIGHESPVILMADQKRTHQLISHLIYNAIKFNRVGGKIQIALTTDKESRRATIQVKDNGQGIDPQFLPHVFEQFKQENMSNSRIYGGLGLGLAICKTIVTQHGGEIMAHSEGVGLGATFTVQLPMIVQTQSSAVATVGNSARQVDLKGLRVLVVDDSKDNLTLFNIWLQACGAEIRTMDSAMGVLEALDEFKPHVLLSDISMPGEDGYSLIAKVRSRSAQRGGRIPAGAITANARTEDRDLSIAAGYHMHIPKPVTAFSLAKAVKSLSEMTQSH